jgi:serine/threonine protein kinase
MVDDSSAHRDESMGEFDPNEITHDGETASNDWLDSNVAPINDVWIGQTIGQFEIIQIIGTGGMGNVYEAKQFHPHRSVALKIVKSAAATPATLHRFEMESEMLARLQHPGIAQVYDGIRSRKQVNHRLCKGRTPISRGALGTFITCLQCRSIWAWSGCDPPRFETV